GSFSFSSFFESLLSCHGTARLACTKCSSAPRRSVPWGGRLPGRRFVRGNGFLLRRRRVLLRRDRVHVADEFRKELLAAIDGSCGSGELIDVAAGAELQMRIARQ